MTYTDDDLLFFRDRLIVPKSLRNHVLNVIHETHQGVYWPGINNEIEN